MVKLLNKKNILNMHSLTLNVYATYVTDRNSDIGKLLQTLQTCQKHCFHQPYWNTVSYVAYQRSNDKHMMRKTPIDYSHSIIALPK